MVLLGYLLEEFWKAISISGEIIKALMVSMAFSAGIRLLHSMLLVYASKVDANSLSDKTTLAQATCSICGACEKRTNKGSRIIYLCVQKSKITSRKGEVKVLYAPSLTRYLAHLEGRVLILNSQTVDLQVRR